MIGTVRLADSAPAEHAVPHEGGSTHEMTLTAMPSPSDTRWKRALDSVLRLARLDKPAPAGDCAELLFLRRLIGALVKDLPVDARAALELRVLQSSSRDELWHLRSQLFGAISLQHGEHEARQRLQQLDAHWH